MANTNKIEKCMTHILTHRGLEPSKGENWYSESSYEAFSDQVSRGFGLEFDLNFVQNDRIIITHNSSQNTISTSLNDGRLCFFEELLMCIKKSSSSLHAIHLKGAFQEKKYLDILIKHIKEYALDIVDRLVIFDVLPDTARYLLSQVNNLHLAPSVSHPYDIKRYNKAVGGTLMPIADAIKYKTEGLYDWVWLDEWDLQDENEAKKIFYNKETFNALQNVGYKIALVTPELHKMSPGLLGGESHASAASKETLFARIAEIITYKPDAICTDYPEEVRAMV